MGRIREQVPELYPHGSLKSLKMDISSGFPLANHFDLPGLLSISGISQDPSVDAHTSLGVARSYRKGLWVA